MSDPLSPAAPSATEARRERDNRRGLWFFAVSASLAAVVMIFSPGGSQSATEVEDVESVATPQLSPSPSSRPTNSFKTQDEKYVGFLQSAAPSIDLNTSTLNGLANLICRDVKAGPVSLNPIFDNLEGVGFSSHEAASLIYGAVNIYCPQYLSIFDSPLDY